MYKLIKTICEFAGRLLSLLLPVKLPELCRAIMAHIYTGYLQHRFAHIGDNCVIAFKATKLHGLDCVSIGNGTQISRGIQLTAWKDHAATTGSKPEIMIGDNCSIRDYCHITAVNSIRIGNNLLTGTNVLITDNSHGTTERSQLELCPYLRKLESKGTVVIGNNVWLGNNVCIMPGVTIGDSVVIGANSVVTKDIPAYSVAAGVPARIVKQV